jgi:hypothetical protein
VKRLTAGAALLFALIVPVVASAPAQACPTGGHEGFVLVALTLGRSLGEPSASYVATVYGSVYAAGEWRLQIKRGDSVITMVGHPGDIPKVDWPNNWYLGPPLLHYPAIFPGDEVTGWVSTAWNGPSVLFAGSQPCL